MGVLGVNRSNINIPADGRMAQHSQVSCVAAPRRGFFSSHHIPFDPLISMGAVVAFAFNKGKLSFGRLAAAAHFISALSVARGGMANSPVSPNSCAAAFMYLMRAVVTRFPLVIFITYPKVLMAVTAARLFSPAPGRGGTTLRPVLFSMIPSCGLAAFDSTTQNERVSPCS